MEPDSTEADEQSAFEDETEPQVRIDGSDNAVAVGPKSFAAVFKIIIQGSRPVITFLLGIVLIGAVLGTGYWWSRQPRRMDGDFNIVVAEFSQKGNEEPKVADIVSQQVFRFLDDQAKLITIEDVQVTHKNIPEITNAEDAKILAKQVNAQLVIYGDVSTLGDEVLLTPQFYIAEAFRADVGELNGQQKLAAPINFSIGELLEPTSLPKTLFQERTVIMTEFTKALVYLALDDLPLAKKAVDDAIQHSELQGSFEGKEVLYLFASQIARLQGDQVAAESFAEDALDLNPQYGRGYIAMANIYYDQGNLFDAIETYKKARALPNQPLGAYIVEKASLGIGNSCWVQLQYVKQNTEPDLAAIHDLEQCAQENFQHVIDFYLKQDNPETNLREMAAWAYYGLGTLAQAHKEFHDSQNKYQQALKLTGDRDLIQLVEPLLKEVE